MIKRKPNGSTEPARISIDIALPQFGRRTDGVARSFPPSDEEAVANYLVDMIGQLECIARATRKDMLAYLLAMASVQASASEVQSRRPTVLH